MHIQFKQILKAFTFMFTISFISCEKDLYDDSIQNESREITIKHITLEDVKSNKKALIKFTNPSSRFKTNTTASSKSLNDTINNFTIETDYGLYIEVGNYNSYTFKIRRPNGSNYLLENIIVSKKNETEYETFINQYNITEQELALIENGEFVDLTGKTNKIALESDILTDHLASKYFFNGSCYEDNYVFVAGNICPAGIHNLSYIMANMGLGSQCEYFLDGTYTATGGSWVVQSSIVPCDNTAGGDSPGGDTSGGHPGSGGSGSTYTGAVGSNPLETRVKLIVKNDFSLAQRNWYNQQVYEVQKSISDYIILNDFSNDSKVFVTTNINFCLSNNSSVEASQNAVDAFQSQLQNLIGNYPNNSASITLPPSCESFNFTPSSDNSNWQQSAVKNIKFRVVVLTPQGAFVNYDIRFPTPTLFGLPINTITYGDISPGFAAELSAQALQISMNETVALYGNQVVSEVVVRYYFIQRLKHNYQIMTNGGRVNFNSMTNSVTPTEYVTNFLGTGDCD